MKKFIIICTVLVLIITGGLSLGCSKNDIPDDYIILISDGFGFTNYSIYADKSYIKYTVKAIPIPEPISENPIPEDPISNPLLTITHTGQQEYRIPKSAHIEKRGKLETWDDLSDLFGFNVEGFSRTHYFIEEIKITNYPYEISQDWWDSTKEDYNISVMKNDVNLLIQYLKAKDSLQKNINIEKYYGNYNGYSVAMLANKDDDIRDIAIIEKVGGFSFVRTASYKIMVWNGSNFYELKDAYSQGFLSWNDIEEIHAIHIK